LGQNHGIAKVNSETPTQNRKAASHWYTVGISHKLYMVQQDNHSYTHSEPCLNLYHALLY